MPDISTLLARIEKLIDEVETEAAARMDDWEKWAIRPAFRGSAANLAAYLAIRHQDLRGLQRELMARGLTSLGRLENRVLATLEALRAVLAALAGKGPVPMVDEAGFFMGEKCLEARSQALFGLGQSERHVALLVTCPSEAIEDERFMRDLAARRIEAIRINCAHDGPDAWARMLANARAAEHASGHKFKIFMDLAGPKIRTGEVRARQQVKRLFPGDRVAMVAPGGLDRPVPADIAFTFECTLREALGVQPGQRLIIDDGKIAARVDAVLNGAVIASVERCKEEGAKLKSEKGINLPDSALDVPALTAKDREDLAFVATHADGIEFSFVQSPDDVALLQEALAEVRPGDWDRLALILKIETAQAVHNLPEIIVRAGARQDVAVMIARGDLAIEIGFTRLAEMQEEILWIAEAAHVPVIWATQVLEHLVKEGMPNRGELTDAAMAARAECVMLNKGPHLIEAIDALDPLLGRMGAHMHKKTPQLRRLMSW
ncbi:MAG: pyruvate kinase [Sphingomonadales bacterium]|nr:MAG: pyruvate kinase [Sphingomonadales bacterium]